jgi:hypothetical protein
LNRVALMAGNERTELFTETAARKYRGTLVEAFLEVVDRVMSSIIRIGPFSLSLA